jgi:hypothetical protein
MTVRGVAALAARGISGPALWGALVTGTVEPGAALSRTFVALVLATVAAVAMETLFAAYAGGADTAGPEAPPQQNRSRDDPPVPTGPLPDPPA